MLSHLFLSSASATAAVSAGLTARSAAPTAKAVDGAGSVVIVTIALLVFTLTRIAAGGLLFGPVGAIVGGTAKKTKMHDTRELYLLITGQEFAALITCNPDDGAKVRQFAVAVMQSALRADELRAHRADAIAQASEPQASQPEASRGAGTDTRPHASETN
jgi:hypothetical protein